MIEKGKKVKFDYILKVDDEEIDNSQFKGPMEYVHGSRGILKGLAENLEGMKVDEEKKICVPAKESYGELKENHPLKGKILEFHVKILEIV